MKIRIFLHCLILWGSTFSAYAQQEDFPTDYFRSPLDIPLLLSGNFGELRGTHFHAGLDLKTEGKEGKKVYAIAKGYISRIKISLWGYGKVIYITHPNGYTSTYGHLQKFNPKLQKYVKELQYNKESYEVEKYFTPSDFPVDKGEVIAYSGNTGTSGGPHLHFEIRETKTQHPLNPLLFGYKISDRIPPAVNRLIAYPIGDNSQINGSQLPIEINITKQTDGTFLADKVEAIGKIGFGIQVIDQQDFTYNRNGAYSVLFSVNGTPYSECVFNKLSFAESRFLLTIIDYKRWKTQKNRIQLTYKTDGNKLSTVYTKMKHNGILNVIENMNYNAKIVAKDFEDNTTDIRIPIQGINLPIKTPSLPKEGKLIIAGRDAYYTFEGGNVYFPKNTFFDDFSIQIKSENDTISIHNSTIPVHYNYNLSIDIPNDTTDLSKTFIAHINDYGQPKFQKTIVKSSYLSTRTRELGKFVLMKDTIAPKIRPINFKNGSLLKSTKKLIVKISDDLSGIKNYTPKLNGKWILMEYEPKRNTLIYDFSDLETYPTNNTLEIEVEDKVGNKTLLETKFKR